MRKAIAGAVAGLAMFAAVGAAQAIEFRPYAPDTFAAAQADGTRAIVFVHAVWCSTCAAQMQVIEENIIPDPLFENVVIFMIDFDTEKPFMRMVRASDRSILIAYRDGLEIGRIHADTSLEGIRALFLSVVE